MFALRFIGPFMRNIVLFSCLFLLLSFAMHGMAQSNDVPLFVNDGEKTIYYVCRDSTMQSGSASDALQNVPGVKVDPEGNVTLRGVNSVEIWIDNRPSHFDEESQKNYLQLTKAATLERIEVMTNPSARYTSATETGIINIITAGKKQRTQSLSIGLQANTNPHVSPRIAYTWSNEKVTFSANLKGTYTHIRSESEGWNCAMDSVFSGSHHTLDTSQHTTFTESAVENDFSINAMMKVDYHINTHNELSAYVALNPDWDKKRTSHHYQRTEYINSPGLYDYAIDEDNYGPTLFGSAGVFYQHLFAKEGHTLSANFDVNFDHGECYRPSRRTYVEQFWLNRDIQRMDNFTDVGYEAKVEYNLPLTKSTDLYIGANDIYKPDNNIASYDTLNFSTGEYVLDELRDENRRFNNNKAEGIVILQQRFGNFTLRPGITYELTRIKATFLQEPQFNTTQFFSNWRPSLHLSYRTKSMHNISLSYTRKSTYAYVRNFTNYIIYEEDNISTGNTDLKPTLTDVVEGCWAKYWDKFGSVSVKGYYKHSKDAINTVTEAIYSDIFGRVVTLNRPFNVGRYTETGGEFNITYRPNAMLNIRLDGNLYGSLLKTEYQGQWEESNMFCYNFRLNVWAKFWNRLEIVATGYYNSPTQTLYTLAQTAYGIDLGVKADFFKNRLSIMLTANDIFNWNKEDSNVFSPTYSSYSTRKTNSRYISLEIAYKIL